mmetsp:Transcript_10406/g.15979  ORF Transcript_10406/g.15979 Transcript_10406/m.15979 type:complete len:89 (+) Transcript_10406:341-607(+)
MTGLKDRFQVSSQTSLPPHEIWAYLRGHRNTCYQTRKYSIHLCASSICIVNPVERRLKGKFKGFPLHAHSSLQLETSVFPGVALIFKD